MAKDIPIIDFSNAKLKQAMLGYIRGLEGPHHFDVRKWRGNRTLPQNAYYHGVVLIYVAEGLKEATGEDWTGGRAHEFCKEKFLSIDIFSKKTGEVIGRFIRSTASLNKEEFAKYIDQIIQFASEQLNVEIPPALRSHSTRKAS